MIAATQAVSRLKLNEEKVPIIKITNQTL